MTNFLKNRFLFILCFCIPLPFTLCACSGDDDDSSSSSATYDLSGKWNYSLIQKYNSDGSLDSEQTGQLLLTQNGDQFTIDVGDGEPESGTIIGNHYTIEYSEPYNGGTSKHKMYFDASSSVKIEGERITTWADGQNNKEYQWNFSAQKVGVLTETWKSSTSEFTLKKDDSGTISIIGEWRSGTVVCKLTSGTAYISTDQLSFNGTGTATNPMAPDGYKTSPFSLQSKGVINNGEYSGNYTLSFTKFGWPSEETFSEVSLKISGDGITNN